MSVKTVRAQLQGASCPIVTIPFSTLSCEADLCIARNVKKGKMLREDSKDLREALFILNYLLKSTLTIKRNFGHSTDQNNEQKLTRYFPVLFFQQVGSSQLL